MKADPWESFDVRGSARSRGSSEGTGRDLLWLLVAYAGVFGFTIGTFWLMVAGVFGTALGPLLPSVLPGASRAAQLLLGGAALIGVGLAGYSAPRIRDQLGTAIKARHRRRSLSGADAMPQRAAEG